MSTKTVKLPERGAEITKTTPITAAEYLTDTTAAEYIGGVKSRAVREWRTRRGLPFIRITAKVIRIRRADLDNWLARHQYAMVGGAK